MAAVAIPMVVGILTALKPILGDLYHFVKGEIETDLHLQHGSSIGQIFKATIDKIKGKGKIDDDMATRLKLGVDIAQIAKNDPAIVKIADESPLIHSVADFANHFDTARIASTLTAAAATPSTPEGRAPPVDEAVIKEQAKEIRAAAFAAAPTGAVQGLVANDKVRLSSDDPAVKDAVVGVLSELPATALVSQPIDGLAEAAPKTMGDLPPATQEAVKKEMATLKRVASVAPTTAAVRGLMRLGLNSSQAIASMPEDHFVNVMATADVPLGEAKLTHQAAVSNVNRYESQLMSLLQAAQPGLNVIDGGETAAGRQLKVKKFLNSIPSSTKANLETLFGSMDQCDCDDCSTVYSPAAYLVDLLEYLRNTPLSSTQTFNASSLTKSGDAPDTSGTVLQKLFQRRPDLGNLQLSCDNTNAVLPYTDLANEVMESFIVSMDSMATGFEDLRDRQLTLDAFNVEGQDTQELLAEPQNVNLEAYRTLANAYTPMNLPYHQAIDSQRAYLGMLGVARTDVVTTFRAKARPIKRDGKDVDPEEMHARHTEIYDRQADAESLGLSQEEYLILTDEVFFPAKFFEITENITLQNEEYKSRIGAQPTYAYWGYKSLESLTSQDEDTRIGLQFVKKQLLPRSGLTYEELISIIETGFVNPQTPRGRAKTIFNELRFSYRFLQTLVDSYGMDPRKKYGKLAEFLVKSTNIARLAEMLVDTSSGSSYSSAHHNGRTPCASDQEVRQWVFDNFENFGKVIVLDSGEGPRLSIAGRVVARKTTSGDGGATQNMVLTLGTLNDEGTIVDDHNLPIAHVTIASRVLYGSASDGATLNEKYDKFIITVEGQKGETLGVVEGGFLKEYGPDRGATVAEWSLTEGLGGGSSIDNVRLIHLDGSPLCLDEWARIQKFIRLWKRMGWSIAETDMALLWETGVTEVAPPLPKPADDCGCETTRIDDNDLDDDLESITFANFSHGPASANNSPPSSGSQNTNTKTAIPSVNVDTIHQLSVIKKILNITGLPVEQLLIFWVSMPTRGPQSLYQRLFLNGSNVPKNDPRFGPDQNGDFFTNQHPCKISDNSLIVQAALGLQATDIEFLLRKQGDADTEQPKALVDDVLNILNLTKIYRFSILAKVLGVDISDLRHLSDGLEGSTLPSPFHSPDGCLSLLQTWKAMQDVGFQWPEFRYVAADIPTPRDPLAPSATTVLSTAKELYEGAQSIRTQHPKLLTPAEATDDVVKAKLSLLFTDEISAQIMSVLDGNFVTVVAAPALDIEATQKVKTASISNKIAYIAANDKDLAHLQVQGIPSDADGKTLRELFNPPPPTDGKDNDKQAKVPEFVTAWIAAVNDLFKHARGRPESIINDSVVSIVPTNVSELLAPDVDDAASGDPPRGSPSQKRFAFMKDYVPFLQDRLTRVLIEETMATAVGFKDKLMANAIIETVTMDLYDNEDDDDEASGSSDKQNGTTAMDFLLEYLQISDASDGHHWSGYLSPTSGASYQFFITSKADKLDPIIINNVSHQFSIQQEYPERLFYTKYPIKLEAGKLYPLEIFGVALSDLQWKSDGSSRSAVPSSILLPRLAQEQLTRVFTSLQSAAIIVKNFNLTREEVLYIYEHSADFKDIKFIDMTAEQLKRLQIYVDFRNTLPKNTEISLIEFFGWAKNYSEQKELLKKVPIIPGKLGAKKPKKPVAPVINPKDDLIHHIVAATGWKKRQVSQILDHADFASVEIGDYKNSLILRDFTQLIALANKLKVEIPRLFAWAAPQGTSAPEFARLCNTAQDMKRVAKSRFSLSTWPDAVRPSSDIIRENSRAALVSYLLVQEDIMRLGIDDADGLFEYFLIDPQMTPLVETSRIKQAIATVQVYVQRCMLGLEEEYGVPTGALDRQKWDWMSKYRVWEANRKVFLYPENWIEPSLRDDKSEIFKALESDLSQKDLTRDAISTALKTYLYNFAELSNLVVAGLCVDYTVTTDPKPVHIFARTMTAPYSFYYNVYTAPQWRGWTKMQVEVPAYSDDNSSMPTNNTSSTNRTGVYIAPLAFNNRVLLFIPQIVKKTIAVPATELTPAGGSASADLTFGQMSGTPINKAQPRSVWEVKMSWSEYRNGAWTPRKLCPDGPIVPYIALDSFFFVPIEIPPQSGTPWREARVAAFKNDAQGFPFGIWSFCAGQLTYEPGAIKESPWPEKPFKMEIHANTVFGYDVGKGYMHSLQAYDFPVITRSTTAQFRVDVTPPYAIGLDNANFKQGAKMVFDDAQNYVPVPLYDARVKQLISSSMQLAPAAGSGTGADVMLFKSLSTLNTAPASNGDINSQEAKDILQWSFGRSADASSFNELSTPSALYNWELGLHGPMLLIDRLLEAQQFDQALEVIHYVFNPTASGDRTDTSRFWVFAPFKVSAQTQTLEQMFQAMGTSEGQDAQAQVQAWRQNPFAPHVVARRRPRAYMIWIVMKYIKILIEYGDYYFRQNTLETIPNAIQMYILASHLYGPRGQKIPASKPAKAHTYNSLVTKFDAFSNAIVQMEEIDPLSHQTPLPMGKEPESSDYQFANVLGFASGLLFSIPSNPDMRALGDTIDDRLFKIRHSQDINGVFRKLPLFEPPIDPALLVAATAAGLSLASVVNDLGGPMPNFRFQYLLGRAIELAGEVKSFGSALLSAQEKNDNEAYALLRGKHEIATQNLVMEMKTLALDEAQKTLDALQYSRNSPMSRMRYYLQVSGEEVSAVPGAAAEFQELNAKLQKPVDVGGLKLLTDEQSEMQLTSDAAILSTTIGAMETLVGVLNAIPDIGTFGTPLGLGANLVIGGKHIGSAVSAAASGMGIAQTQLSFQAGAAGRKAGALRALNDRLLQVNMAGYEISQIDKQIIASQVRVAMANKDITTTQKAIDQAREADEFLRSKYTNTELYTWLFGQTKSLYYNSYTQAYDIARKVEKVLKFERPQLASTVFIQPGYWNASRDGLLAGEALYHGLKQIEAAYLADRGHDYEVTKNISLRQIHPRALLQLRETGTTEFSVPEVLFDMDFPGHYLRRIKSISVTIPCILGPHAGVNCTLRLLSNKFRQSPSLAGGYPESLSTAGAVSDTRFATTNVPITSIAVSSGQQDTGVFEFTFTGERYLPFEGAGAISTWRLELPSASKRVRAFDYSTIADVVLTMRYTSSEGGSTLRDQASQFVDKFAEATADVGQDEGLFALFDLKTEYAAEWNKFVRKPASSSSPNSANGDEGSLEKHQMHLTSLVERLPLFTVAGDKSDITARQVWVVAEGASSDLQAKIQIQRFDDVNNKLVGNPIDLAKLPTKEDSKGTTQFESAAEINTSIGSWSLSAEGGDLNGVKRMWLVVKYKI